LQGETFTRLGETTPRRADFRLVSATNRDLEALVAAGGFREDLYYRLAVFPIRIPSLRERLADIPYLVEGILALHAQRFRIGSEPPMITENALAELKRHRWPGNVRELENVVVRAAIMASGSPIDSEHLPELELLSAGSVPPEAPAHSHLSGVSVTRSLAAAERDHIVAVLRSQGGNVSAAAKILAISRTTLYKKIRDHELSTSS